MATWINAVYQLFCITKAGHLHLDTLWIAGILAWHHGRALSSVWRPKFLHIFDGQVHFWWKSRQGPDNCPELCTCPMRLLYISALQTEIARSRAVFLNNSKVTVASLMFSETGGLKNVKESTAQGPEGLAWMQAWKDVVGRERDRAINPPYFCSALLDAFVLYQFQKQAFSLCSVKPGFPELKSLTSSWVPR